MLKPRIIIALLFNEGVLFRTKKFIPDYRYTLNFVGTEAADEIFIVDITRGGPYKGHYDAIAPYIERAFLPCTLGGHIREVSDARSAFAGGADKIVLEQAFYERPGVARELAARYGSQAVTIGLTEENGEWVTGRTKTRTGLRIGEAAKLAVSFGAGEIFLQSMALEGSLGGYPVMSLAGVLAAAPTLPIVVGAGCGNWLHMKEALEAGASGCVTTVIHHFPDAALWGMKKRINETIKLRMV